jgi:hypothetical protein
MPTTPVSIFALVVIISLSVALFAQQANTSYELALIGPSATARRDRGRARAAVHSITTGTALAAI